MNPAQPNEIAVGASYQDMPIHDLQDAIRKENGKARSLARKSLEHVRSCGEMLIALKAKTHHGSWKYTVKTLNMSQKTASNYMRIASNWQRVAVLDHGVKDALALLCREDAPPPSPRSSPRPSAPITIEAEVVTPSSPSPVPAPAVIEAEIVEPSAPGAEDQTHKRRQPLKIAHAMGIFYVAKNQMEKIAKNDIERIDALKAMIGYCQKRLALDSDKPKQTTADAFLTIMEQLPELDQSELRRVINAIESRWMRGGKENA